MMIRQDFEQLPPKYFLMQIFDPITKFYCFLWDKKDNNHKVKMSWKESQHYYNKNTFRSSLRKLCNEGLLNYRENPNGVSVELVAWDDVEE